MPSLHTGQQKLSRDLSAAVEDAERLLRLAATEAGSEYKDARERLGGSLQSAKGAFMKVEEATAARVQAAGRTSAAFVREHPWQALGLAAGIGVLAALVATRR